jgi:hypothetical protein
MVHGSWFMVSVKSQERINVANKCNKIRGELLILQPNSRTELCQTPEWNYAKLPNVGCKLLYGRKLQT